MNFSKTFKTHPRSWQWEFNMAARQAEVDELRAALEKARLAREEMVLMLKRCLLESRSVDVTWPGPRGSLTNDIQELLLQLGIEAL